MSFPEKIQSLLKKFSKIDKKFVSQSILEVGHFTIVADVFRSRQPPGPGAVPFSLQNLRWEHFALANFKSGLMCSILLRLAIAPKLHRF